MIFKETPIFQKELKKLKVSNTAFSSLKKDLEINPQKGDLIIDGQGLRKIRIQLGSKGKRGGARVIYYNIFEEAILFLYIYSKSNMENLSKKQLSKLKEIVK